MTAVTPTHSSRSGPVQTPWSRPHFREEQTEKPPGPLHGRPHSPALLVTPCLVGAASPPPLRPSPRPGALPSGRHPCCGSARLPGALGDMGAHLPATWPFVGRSAPWDPWGPFLGLASPVPPTRISLPVLPAPSPSQGSPPARTGLFWASHPRGQALSLPTSGAPTLDQS